MKHFFSVIVFCLLASGLLGGMPAAQASHLLGADLTYTALGNNQYRVKFRVYQDCSGASTPSFTLACRTGGCNSPATVTASLLPQGAVIQPAPLCASTPGTCQNPSSQFSLFSFATYEASVTLPPGQWTMSTSQTARPVLANVVSGDLYAEAYLDNSGTNVANSSPQFDAQDIPVQYVCWRQPTTFGFSALEPDGDSVAYSLAAPLQACNTPVTYLPTLNVLANVVIIRTNPLCIFNHFGDGYFSPTLPLLVTYDTTGTCPVRQGTPSFHLNQDARTVTFSPTYYYANTSPANGNNKYLMAVRANEYRRINGVRRLIGSILHEVVFIVTDCAGDAVPNPVVATNLTTGASARTINTPDTTQISVYACSFSRVKLDFTDPDNLRTVSAHQPLMVTMPADINTNPLLLDAGDIGTFSLSGNGTEHPVGTFYFQPSPTAVGRTIRVNVRIEDDACPVKARQNRVIVIKVLRGEFAVASAPGATGGSATPVVYLGDSLALQGRAMRPDSVRRLATSTTVAQTYTYRWTVRGDGLTPTTSTSQNIFVKPTATSRYFLAVTPVSGFSGGCVDTTSILVQVLTPFAPAPTISRTGTTLTSSAATGNQWYLNGVLIPGATGQSITATAAGTYTVRATVVVGGRSYVTAMSAPVAITVLAAQHALPGTSLTVAPNPTPDGRVSITLTNYPQPVALTVLDALGRSVAHAAAPVSGTMAIDLSALPAGLYLLQVRAGAGLETRRIVRE